MDIFDQLPGATPEFRALLAQSIEDVRIKTAAHDSTWHLANAAWAVDQNAGTIVFTAPDGIVATCRVQIIGTYNTADGTWLWGWDHPSVKAPLDIHAQKLKGYGEEHGITPLTTRKLKCTEGDAWQFAALACHLCEAQGAYRGPSGSTLVFMTFTDVTLRKPGAAPTPAGPPPLPRSSPPPLPPSGPPPIPSAPASRPAAAIPATGEPVDGLGAFFQRIGAGLQASIPEDWITAKAEAIFFSDSSTYVGEYVRKADRALRSTTNSSDNLKTIREMREKFRAAGKRLWGQFTFEMDASGKFNVHWGYENCDANGDTIFNEEESVRRSEDRWRRLSAPPPS